MMNLFRSLGCASLASALLASVFAQDAVAQDFDAAAFRRKPSAWQKQRVAEIEAALAAVEHKWLAALTACAASAAEPGAPRVDEFPLRRPKKPKPGAVEDVALPATVEYRFGEGVVRPVPELAKANPQVRALAERVAFVESAELGVLPGSDAAVAALLRRIDTDHSADRFAAFLESWRNGEESFYEALDRTAGTPDRVFFYDVMLQDFVSDLVPKSDREARSGLQASHDALHEGFLAYRQYRAFREAVVLSLVLPPERPLPARLARYEAKASGSYSLREQVQMVLAVEGFDPRRVVDLVAASAPPLGDPLWSQPYDPYPGWHAVFSGHMDAMIEAAGNTDSLLAMARYELTSAAEAIADAAHTAGIEIKR